MAKILLTGASGQVSSATIAALKGTGHQVIGLVRDPAKGERLGIEVRVGDLNRPRTLEGAFDGIDTAFLLTAPTDAAPYHMSNALWAAKRAVRWAASSRRVAPPAAASAPSTAACIARAVA